MTTRKLPPAVSRAITTDRDPPAVRRRFPRVEVNLAAQYTIEGQIGWTAGFIDNLGGGGVRLQTEEDIVAGTAMVLRFIVDGTQIVATARVAMSLFDRARDRYIHGLAFTAIDPQQRQAIVNRVLALGGGDRP